MAENYLEDAKIILEEAETMSIGGYFIG